MLQISAELASWINASTLAVDETSSALIAAKATLGCSPVYIVASDSSSSRGALGLADVELFRRAVSRAQAAGITLLLAIDSAGAKLNDGVAIQGALRKLVTELLDARINGLRIVSVFGRNVFGGASFIGYIAGVRIYANGTRLAMTGPGVLLQHNEASEGEIGYVIQSTARVARGDADFLMQDYSIEEALLFESAALEQEREILKRRLISQKMLPTEGAVTSPDEHSVRCEGSGNVGAADALLLAETLERCIGPIELFMSWQAHSLKLEDEKVLLSQYLMHLARSMRQIVAKGIPVTLHIEGHIAGGFYLAVAGPASRVVLHGKGSVRTLPKAALSEILKNDVEITEHAGDPIHLGLADSCEP